MLGMAYLVGLVELFEGLPRDDVGVRVDDFEERVHELLL